MREFFKELFQYNNHFNQQLISVLNENSNSASEQCITLMSHIINAHQIWNSKIVSDQFLYGPWDLHSIHDMQMIDKRNFECSIFILDSFELAQTIQYSNSKGQPFENSVSDILFQVINHSTYHRGQIATGFRQSGLEPLLTDYIYYKMI